MASCVQCGKPIGLIEYTFGDSNQLGLCKNCRKTQKLCDNCGFMLTISMEDSAIIRCIKYGYNLTNKKDRTKAANCKDYTSKIPTDPRKTKNKTHQKTKSSSSKARKGNHNGWFYGSNHPTP
jgi:hypothetical protein